VFGFNIDRDEFAFMIGKRVCSISKVGETTNVFIELESATLNVECFWRLREPSRMIVTSKDKKYPDRDWSKDPIEEIQRILTGQCIRSCKFVEDTQDLFIQFEGDIWLDVLSDSTMFESWQIDADEHGYYVGKA
jgi:hypothetical protein